MSNPALQDTYDTVRISAYESSKAEALRFRSGTNDVNRMYWNCYPVGVADKSEVWIQKRSPILTNGNTLTVVTGAVNCAAMYNLSVTQLSDVFVAAVWDNTNSRIQIIQYRPINNTSAIIGTLTGATATDEIFLSELNIGGTPYLGVVYHNLDSTSSKAYYAASSGGLFPSSSLTQITDADFPTNIATPDPLIGPMVQLDGTTYVSTKSGKIYGSDLNSITSWNALNVIQAIQYPDNLVGLVRFKHFIMAFGSDSIEAFYDAGNAAPASPLTRTDQAFIKFGCIHPRSFYNIDDKLYWIGRSYSGTNGLWMMDGSLTPVKISQLPEDALISRSSDLMLSSGPHVARIWPFLMGGKKHLAIGSGFLDMGLAIGQTFTGDINSLATSDLQSGTLCMTIDEHEFWVFKAAFSTASTTFFPMFVTNFENWARGANVNDQYAIGAYTGLNWNTTTGGQIVFSLSGTVTNASTAGSDLSDAVFTATPITSGVQLSGKDFGNSKNKRISQLTLVQRGFRSTDSASTVWLIVNKNDNFTQGVGDTTAITGDLRSLTLPVNDNRAFWKRLGIARSWTFGVVSKNSINWSLRELEVNISQGTT